MAGTMTKIIIINIYMWMNLGVIDEGNQQRPYQSQYSDSFGRSFGTDSGIVIMKSEVNKIYSS